MQQDRELSCGRDHGSFLAIFSATLGQLQPPAPQIVWGLLSAMIFFGFVASSVLDGKDPFAPGATITQPSAMKGNPVQAGQQPKHSHKAAQTPSQ
jgi:hypothetical protein